MEPITILAFGAAALLVAAGVRKGKHVASRTPGGGGGGQSSFVPTAARDASILEAIAAGEAVLPDFTAVQAQRDGHLVEVYAANDALRLGGSRVMVSHALAQAIADDYGLVLPTSRMSDMAWLSVPPELRLGPVTRPADATMDDEVVAVSASQQVDQAMAGKGIPVGSFVRVVGKEWVASERLLEPPGTPIAGCQIDAFSRPIANIRQAGKRLAGTVAGCNFGWQWSGGQSKTPGQLPCVQPTGLAHGTGHFDYSQLLTLYQPTCAIDGEAWNVVDVLLDPAIAYLLSDEVVPGQACRVTRHPAFPLVE